MDISTLSDEHLMQMLKAPAQGGGDLSSMSDTDLMKALSSASFAERFAGEGGGERGALEDGLIEKAEGMGRATRLESLLTGAVDGIALGFADEGAAGINALVDYATGNAPNGLGAAYDRRLASGRRQMRDAEARNPGTYLTGNIGGTLVPAIAAGPLASSANLGIRTLQGAAVGGALGGAAGFGSGEGIADRAEKGLRGARDGAILGGVAEPVMAGAGAVARKVFGGAKAPAGVGEIVEQADEFGVPLSRGQATGDITQQAFEEAARNDARGPFAGKVMRSFDERQAEAIQAAKQGIAGRIGGQAPDDIASGGEAIATGLRNKAASLKASADDAYISAAGKQAEIAIDEVRNLGQKVVQSLTDEGINLDTYGNYPGAQSALSLLRRVSGFEGAPAGENVVAQSLQGIEQARKALVKIKGGNAEDFRAVSAIKRAFDDWLDDAIDQRLFSGDPSALDDLKKGRELWSKYKGLTAGKKGDAAPVVSKMIEEGRTGEEVANWLIGASSAGQQGRAARIAVEIRKALGPDSEEWQILRQMAWQKATNPTRGTGNQALTKSVAAFASSPLAKTLFTGQERGQMVRFAQVVGKTVTDPRATNRGQSGYEILRAMGGPLGQLGAGVMGAGGAYATGDNRFLALAALPLFKNVSSVSKAAAARKALPSAVGKGVSSVVRPLTFTVSPLAIGQQR